MSTGTRRISLALRGRERTRRPGSPCARGRAAERGVGDAPVAPLPTPAPSTPEKWTFQLWLDTRIDITAPLGDDGSDTTAHSCSVVASAATSTVHHYVATSEKNKPLEQSKTNRWLRGLQQCAEFADQLAGVRPVAVLDRAADVFDLFAEQHRLGTVDLLVRAKHNRSLGKDLPKLFDAVQAKPVQAHLEMHVVRRSARRGTRQQKARAGHKAREAKLALRWCAVQLPVPSKSSCQGPGPLQLSLVHVCEESVPDNLEPLEWFLLTSLPVTSGQQALKILAWYRLRWRIEDWHRVLKSGCKVEYLGHRIGERIERAVTINAVIAWRLTAMTLLGRDTPELPADILFSDIEIIALEDFAKDR